jgi:hypothetical protein
VIAGEKTAVEQAREPAKAAGAKRVVPLMEETLQALGR